MTQEAGKADEDGISSYLWMVRPCLIYQEEYSDCTSLKGRFHQYFIHGETVDCAQWGRDADNCSRWEDNKDKKAVTSLIESEKRRREGRLKAYIQNDISELRRSPPKDWNKPLPEWMQKEYATTYLSIKNQERNSATASTESGRFCVIS